MAPVTGWTASSSGWLPFVFLAIALFFIFTWMGGFLGIQIPNQRFRRFQKILDEGKHVFFVDVSKSQKKSLMDAMAVHSKLKFAGEGKSMPSWIVNLESKTNNWWYWRMWRNA